MITGLLLILLAYLLGLLSERFARRSAFGIHWYDWELAGLWVMSVTMGIGLILCIGAALRWLQ